MNQMGWGPGEHVATHLETLETPVPIVDLDRLTHNLDRMAAYATLHDLRLRPHVKTHKAPRIATEQLQRGAVGLTCATTHELECMADVCDDLLLAYPPVGAARLERLMRLPSSVRLTVAVDSADCLPALGMAARLARRELEVYVEVDMGMQRVGVAPSRAAATLAKAVRDTDALRFAGLTFYPGHVRERVGEQGSAIASLGASLHDVHEALLDAGLPPRVISGGSTPLAWRIHEVPGVTEVRPGTYVYNDRTTAAINACDWDDCALTVLATVVSTAVPGQCVVDAGTKALAREPLRGAGAAHPGGRPVRCQHREGAQRLRDDRPAPAPGPPAPSRRAPPRAPAAAGPHHRPEKSARHRRARARGRGGSCGLCRRRARARWCRGAPCARRPRW
jgi:D-serine deaminase-like pyridoxal phosphate-dependent protein